MSTAEFAFAAFVWAGAVSLSALAGTLAVIAIKSVWEAFRDER